MLAYLTNPFIQIMDTNGTPVAGAKIYVYNADTTNLATTYSDFDGSQNTNPVIADELGNVTIIADDGLVYDIEIKNPDDDLLFGKKYISPGEGGMSVSGCVVSAGPGIIVNQSVQNNKTVFTVLTDSATIPTFSDLSAYQQNLSAGNNIVFSGNTVNLADTVIIGDSAYEHRITKSTDRLENTTAHNVNLQNPVQNIITDNNGYSNDMRAGSNVLSHGTEINTTEVTANTISSYAAGKNTYSRQTYNAVVVNSASTVSPYLGTSAKITPDDVKVVNRVASGEVVYSLTGLQTAVDAILPYSGGLDIKVDNFVIGVDSNGSSVGQYNFVAGHNTLASGDGNIVAGYNNSATGDGNVMFGYNNVAYGNLVNTVGQNNQISAVSSTINGSNNIVDAGDYTAMIGTATVSYTANENINVFGVNNMLKNVTNYGYSEVIIGDQNSSYSTDSSNHNKYSEFIIGNKNKRVNTDSEFTYENIIMGTNNNWSAVDGGNWNNVIGADNNISGCLRYSNINGCRNSVDGDVGYAVINGYENRITGNRVYENIAIGTDNEIYNISTAHDLDYNTLVGHNNTLTSPASADLSGPSGGVGFDNTVIGYGNKVTAFTNIALGNSNKLDSRYSVAVGYSNDIYRFADFDNDIYNDVAVGQFNKITGARCSTFGIDNTTSGSRTHSFGDGNYSNGNYNTIIGFDNSAENNNNTLFVGSANSAIDGTWTKAIGESNIASGGEDNHFFGYRNSAIGHYRTYQIGSYLKAQNNDCWQIGAYNQGKNTNALLEIGWGSSNTNRKTVFLIDKNGNVSAAGTITTGVTMTANS